GIQQHDGVHMAVRHSEDVIGLGHQFSGQMPAAMVGDVDAELVQRAHRVVAGGLSIHGAHAGGHDAKWSPSAHGIPEQTLGHGAATHITSANEQNGLHPNESSV